MLGTIFLGTSETTNDSAPAAPSVDAKSCDPVKLGTLGKLLGVKGSASGAPLDPTAAEHWVIPISGPLVTALAKLDAKKRPAIAKSWAATEEWKADGGTAKSLDTMLAGLAKLAATAVAKKRPLYLWLSL